MRLTNGHHTLTTTAPVEIVALKAQGYWELVEGEEAPEPKPVKKKTIDLLYEDVL